jgi:translocation and assembly module TamB
VFWPVAMARLGLLRICGGLLVLLLAVTAILWVGRKPIADEVLQRALKARGVRADYAVKSVGLRWERIEKLRIGDPAAPDLTAEWAEVRLSAGLGGVQAAAIRAGGVRIRGRLVDGRFLLGDLDKLLPKSDGKGPFALPKIDLDVADARVRLESKWGLVAARIDGRGNLASVFNGKIAAVAPALVIENCKTERITAYINVAVSQGAPTIRGPVRANSATCGGNTVSRPEMLINAALGGKLAHWRGSAVVKAETVKSGLIALAGPTGKIDFDGNQRDTRGSFRILSASGRLGPHKFANAAASGDFRSTNGPSFDGRVQVERFTPDRNLLAKIGSAARGSDGTPLGPLLAQLSRTLSSSAAVMRVDSDFRYGAGRWQVSRIAARGQNGAQVMASGGRGIEYGQDGVSADLRVSLMGGGLPATRATLQRRADGTTLGLATIARYAAGASRLALAPVKFAMNSSGAMRFETIATLDGPLNSGRVEALKLPVNATITADGRLIINNGCTPVQFDRLTMANFALGPTETLLCPDRGQALFAGGGGAAVIANPRFNGRIGAAPLVLSAQRVRFEFGKNGFSATELIARLGSGSRVSQLNLGSVDGRLIDGALQGKLNAMSAKIANVPLLIDGGSGHWRYAKGRFALNGNVRASDEAVPARFNSLVSNDAKLDLADGKIAMTGTLRLPNAKPEVASVQIAHNLSAGTGTGRLDVTDLRFGNGFQPEQLTRLTLGVIANVSGTISGSGDIRWTPEGVTSTGRFITDRMDFAAAFGPVTGLKGQITFDDLLALTTPPGQKVSVAAINPGTLVTSGVVQYRLLPGQRVAVENGIWPFAGGDLILDPTILDMGVESERRLTFRVVGLDAAKFIQQLEFEDLAASGTFDGIMPMIFDETGGRIEGGRLVVRQGGGTLAYIGDVSNADMNIFAEMAFDALKSIRYQRLTIGLNGPLDGEIISQIYFNGINEAPLSPPKSFISRQFIGLPFVFNIKVTAPFRRLLNTARTLQDPSLLLQETLPGARKNPVQPAESDTKR